MKIMKILQIAMNIVYVYLGIFAVMLGRNMPSSEKSDV